LPIEINPFSTAVLKSDEISLVDIAGDRVIVCRGDLPPECKVLYDKVTGEGVVLDYPGFPFAKTVLESLLTPGRWCYEMKKKKIDDGTGTGSDPKNVYLRITAGNNNGNSPGNPYVMEIWPPHSESVIH
jgi:hypothetical protein